MSEKELNRMVWVACTTSFIFSLLAINTEDIMIAFGVIAVTFSFHTWKRNNVFASSLKTALAAAGLALVIHMKSPVWGGVNIAVLAMLFILVTWGRLALEKYFSKNE